MIYFEEENAGVGTVAEQKCQISIRHPSNGFTKRSHVSQQLNGTEMIREMELNKLKWREGKNDDDATSLI